MQTPWRFSYEENLILAFMFLTLPVFADGMSYPATEKLRDIYRINVESVETFDGYGGMGPRFYPFEVERFAEIVLERVLAMNVIVREPGVRLVITDSWPLCIASGEISPEITEVGVAFYRVQGCNLEKTLVDIRTREELK